MTLQQQQHTDPTSGVWGWWSRVYARPYPYLVRGKEAISGKLAK